MKKDKVFSVVKVEVWDGEETVTVEKVTTDRSKAEKCFKKLVKEDKAENQWWSENEPDFEDFSDSDTEYCCWESGYFCQNHVYISINENTLD